MARHLLRNLALSGAAALSFATVTTPDTNKTLSGQRAGNAQAAEEVVVRVTEEARALNREFQEIAFQERSLQTAQQSLNDGKDNVAERIRALETINSALQERISARNARVEKLHEELLTNPAISEADANFIYTRPFEGEKYAHYYQERMAYRDECNSDTACMERMDDTEGSRQLTSFATRTGAVFGGALGALFGLSALGGAAGGMRRRRAEEAHRARVADTRDMLKPKNG